MENLICARTRLHNYTELIGRYILMFDFTDFPLTERWYHDWLYVNIVCLEHNRYHVVSYVRAARLYILTIQ